MDSSFAWLVVVQADYGDGTQAIRRARIFTHFDTVTCFGHVMALEIKIAKHFKGSFLIVPQLIWFQRLPADDGMEVYEMDYEP